MVREERSRVRLFSWLFPVQQFLRRGGPPTRRRLTSILLFGGGLLLAGTSVCDAQFLPTQKNAPRSATQAASSPPATSTPGLVGIAPTSGCAGDVIALQGVNLPLDPDAHRVTFLASNFSGVAIPGQVLQVVAVGVDPQGNPLSRLEVVVPTGVRDSMVVLDSLLGDDFVSVGVAPFSACPAVTGIVYGAENEGVAVFDPLGGFFPSQLTLVGFNLTDAVTVLFVDELGVTHPVTAIQTGPALGAAYSIPSGLEAITVSYPAGLEFVDCFDAGRIRITVATPEGLSNEVDARVRQFPGASLGDVPATLSGVFLESGVRAGQIEVSYALLAEPPTNTYRMVPEYFDATTSSYFPCTPAEPEMGEAVVSGSPQTPSGRTGLIGPGSLNHFAWNSALDLGGQAGVTHLRLRPELAAGAPSVPCPATDWITESLAFDHTASAPAEIVETFDTRAFMNSMITDADWNTSLGVVRGTGNLGQRPFGQGTDGLVFLDGRQYVIDTSAGQVLDVTVPGSPIDVFPSNPGAPVQEFHVSVLFVAPKAEIAVVGDHPLVFRCTGTGDPNDDAVVIRGTFDLRGQPGTDATGDQAGQGGAGGPGGGNGGDGGHVFTNAFFQLITEERAATRGEGPGGGGAGQNQAMRPRFGNFAAQAGSGGGGGGALAGEDGYVQPGLGSLPPVRSGSGGTAVGDVAITYARGGSGGGGGGASTFRIGSGQLLNPRPGGAGGGGGGGCEIIADGSIVVFGQILCDGGEGSRGNSIWFAPGGGGSGGSIALRAAGSIRVSRDAVLSARGGGGAQGSTILKGGDGSEGRIRFEWLGTLLYPGLQVTTNVDPSPGDPSGQAIVNPGPFDLGSGIDGALVLSGQAGTFVADTDSGLLFDPGGGLVLAASSGGGEFELTELLIPETVTLVGVGSNPLILRVLGDARIDGTVDVSGADGGFPDFSNPANPLPGAGGAGGPGAGAGGAGGIANGTLPVSGDDGGLPPGLPPELGGAGPVPPPPAPPGQPAPILIAAAAEGGASLNGTLRAGAGGGGGFGADGDDGTAEPPSAVSGTGGRGYGTNSAFHPITLGFLPLGGSGGGGGGGSQTPPAPGAGAHSPGSGGGGGGGYLQVTTGGSLRVGATARLLANGGNAYAAGGRGGSAGGGSGGAIRLQAQSLLQLVDPGPIVQALGGQANLPHPSGMFYPTDPLVRGGQGSVGRISIESPLGFSQGVSICPPLNAPGVVGICPAPSTAPFLEAEGLPSVAQTRAYRVTTASRALATGTAGTAMPLPQAGGDVLPLFRLFFSGAQESSALPGTPGAFSAWTDDPTTLGEIDFLRARIRFLGDPVSGAQPEVDELRIPVAF